MPHIIIEYSDNLAESVRKSELMKRAYNAVLDSKLFPPEAVKARAIGYSDYILPEGVQSFIHITVSILTGRSIEQRSALSESIFSVSSIAVSNADKISVDIHEMSKETYKK